MVRTLHVPTPSTSFRGAAARLTPDPWSAVVSLTPAIPRASFDAGFRFIASPHGCFTAVALAARSARACGWCSLPLPRSPSPRLPRPPAPSGASYLALVLAGSASWSRLSLSARFGPSPCRLPTPASAARGFGLVGGVVGCSIEILFPNVKTNGSLISKQGQKNSPAEAGPGREITKRLISSSVWRSPLGCTPGL